MKIALLTITLIILAGVSFQFFAPANDASNVSEPQPETVVATDDTQPEPTNGDTEQMTDPSNTDTNPSNSESAPEPEQDASATDMIASVATPDYVKLYADGTIEVRSFTSDNPMCGVDEVVEVSTNQLIHREQMCEANITDVRIDDQNVIITKDSLIGTEEIVVAR